MVIHSAVKPYQCAVCGKCLTQKVNLKTHLKIHTGEHPFQRTLCGKNFVQKKSLKVHYVTHYNILTKIVT
ncbi:Gastrula zinc finger protein, partial [Stegodyphus mimosarum]